MKCKNCGAKVQKESSICPNCGATVNKKSDYVLLTNQDKIYEDTYSSDAKKQLSKAFLIIISVLLIVGAGVLSYFLFYSINSRVEKPSLPFSSGYGIINDNERVIYAVFDDPSMVQYIHGVNLYSSAVDEKSAKHQQSVESDYNYTKNVDDSFRAIYFDMDKLDLDKKGNYTYTFEIKVSNYNDENKYTYYQTVNFTGSTKRDIADIVFDHSLNESKQEQNTQDESESTSQSTNSNDFIYDSYWYTTLEKYATYYRVVAFRFNKDNTVTSTEYRLDFYKECIITTDTGTYKINGNTINTSMNDGTNSKITIDKKKQSLSQGNQKLSPKKFNCVKNANEIFTSE